MSQSRFVVGAMQERFARRAAKSRQAILAVLTILTAQGICRSHGTVHVLQDAALAVEAGERVGLVGRNGSGKSTLARILAGREAPDAGEVVCRTGLTVGYLDQDPSFEPGQTAVDVVLGGLPAWREALQRHTDVSKRLERGEGDLEALLEAQAEAAEQVEQRGGWDRTHAAEAMLDHLGITEVQRAVDRMSGGERRRVALARLLVAEPELAILDEPTNHLDVPTVEWLEQWLLRRYRGALLLVTHDRYLLDRVTTRTLEVERGEVRSYDGGWGRYLEAKAEQRAHAERVEANRRNFLRRELEWLRRSPKARSTKQKARVDRVQSARDHAPPPSEQAATFMVGEARSGRTILEAEDVVVKAGERTLVDGFTLRLSKGERIGLVGPNGCGKTSLLRVLTGSAEPVDGVVRLGKNTRIAYLDQQRAALDEGKSVFENVARGRSQVVVGGQQLEVRSYLERFLFDGSEQRQRVGTLSGGERARVALARILAEDANLVVLDEPTNDLDVMTLAALEEALLEFGGTLLVVTHDRWFLDRIATALLVFEPDGITRHEGGYSDYLQRRSSKQKTKETRKAKTKTSRDSSQASPDGGRGDGPKRLSYAERIELDGLLDRVEAAEHEVAQLEHELSQPEFYERPDEECRAAVQRLQRAREESERLTERWAELEARRDP